jgi:hypothetical protein
MLYKKMCLLAVCTWCWGSGLLAQHHVEDITRNGAVADSLTDNTAAIQKTIDQVHANGGGTVLVPAGKFVTGVLHLQSNVELHLAEGAVLLGSVKRADYGAHSASALIVAEAQNNIAITGKGIIDGRGEALMEDIYRMLHAGTLEDKEWQTYNPWHQMRPEERNRPKLVEFLRCSGVRIKNITIKNGLCWIQNYKECTNLDIDSVQVESNTFLNNDGIDVVDCKNVRITHCFINAADDGICLKSENRNSRCENVYVAYCRVRSSASAVKLGTASWGGFKNIRIHDIEVYDTYRSAIALESVDGGVLENVEVRNIHAVNTGNAVFIRLGHRNKDSVVSQVRHIFISNVKAVIPAGKPDKGYNMEGPPLRYPHNTMPASVTGLPGHPVEDVVLDNISIRYEGGGSRDTAYFPLDSFPHITENASGYPEFSMFGELPVWGFYTRHVNGIRFRNCEIGYAKEDYRVPMLFDDVNNLQLKQLTIASGKEPFIILHNTTHVTTEQLHLPTATPRAVLRTGVSQ